MYLAGDTPLPRRVRLPAARRPAARAARRTSPSASCSRSTVRNASAWARRRAARPRAALDRRRPPPRQLALRRRSTTSSRTRRRPARSSRDLFRELDVELTPAIAEALYVALVTDTGRFQYTNTTPKALRLAAELVEAGVDVQRVFQQVYESVEFAKLKLLARALDRAQVYEGGRLVISYLLRSDFHELGVGEEYAEGIIDYLRSVEGSELAAMIREPPEPPDAPRLAALERRRGGRVRDRAQSSAAAATARRPASRARSRSRRSSSSSRSAFARPLPARALEPVGHRARRQAGGAVVVRDRRAAAGPHRRADRPRRDARPVRDRPPARPPRRVDAARAVPRRARQAVRDRHRPHRDDGDRRPEGDVVERHEPPAPSSSGSTRLRGEIELPVPGRLGREDRRRACYRLHRRGVEVEMPLRRSTVTADVVAGYADAVATLDLRVCSRHVRAGDRRRRSAATAATLRRLEVGPFRSTTPCRPSASSRRRLLSEEEVLAAL